MLKITWRCCWFPSPASWLPDWLEVNLKLITLQMMRMKQNDAEFRGEIIERNQIGIKLEFSRLESLYILKVCTYCIGIKE